MYSHLEITLIAVQYIHYCNHYLYAQEKKESCVNGNSGSKYKLDSGKNCVKRTPINKEWNLWS
jgi:hypothetical protein